MTDTWVAGSDSSASLRKRGLVRRDPPVWPFFWRGLLPLLGLIALFLYAIWPFARGEIEAVVQRQVAQALAEQGLSGVQVQVTGQQVLLTGSLKPGFNTLQTLAIAQKATCPTWLGPQVCAELVIGQFDALPSLPNVPGEPKSPALASASLTPTIADKEACESTLSKALEGQSIQFFSASTRLTANSGDVLDRVAQAHGSCKGMVRVEGHTDNVGGDVSNQRLSLARAQAVREELVKRGISAERLLAEGFGPTRPVADNATAQGRQQNRRIEFKLVTAR